MSSEYSSAYAAAKCMDGNLDTYCYNKKGGDRAPFFMVDFTEPVKIHQVRLIATNSYPQYAKYIDGIVTNDTNFLYEGTMDYLC